MQVIHRFFFCFDDVLSLFVGIFQEQFEKDLDFFKGNDWRETYVIRESVQNYLQHLNKLNDENPLMLVAYVYHLYMGLLSGGQILAKKRNLEGKIVGFFKKQRVESEGDVQPGHHLTTFVGEKSISDLKNQMRKSIDTFAEDLDEKTRQGLIEESKRVFELNNVIIKSVEGVNEQLEKRVKNFVAATLLVVLGAYLIMKLMRL